MGWNTRMYYLIEHLLRSDLQMFELPDQVILPVVGAFLVRQVVTKLNHVTPTKMF